MARPSDGMNSEEDITSYALPMYELSSGASQYALLDAMNDSGYKFAVSGDGSVVGVITNYPDDVCRIYERSDDGFDQRG